MADSDANAQSAQPQAETPVYDRRRGPRRTREAPVDGDRRSGDRRNSPGWAALLRTLLHGRRTP